MVKKTKPPTVTLTLAAYTKLLGQVKAANRMADIHLKLARTLGDILMGNCEMLMGWYREDRI